MSVTYSKRDINVMYVKFSRGDYVTATLQNHVVSM